MGQIVRQQNFQRSPNLISICVDEIRNGELSGRLYHCYSEEACPFSNVAHLIELAENLFDQIKFPQASTQMRTFTEKSQKTVQPPEKKKSAEELEKERGKKGTMLLYVQYRQRSTWQGMVKWVEGDQEWKFFSELDYVMHPHIMVEMTDRPNITQNIIVTMSNNEMIIEICRKNALREN